MQSEFIKKLKLPDKPGVYFFLKGKEILYIGKATSLRDRTKSYFSNDLINTRGPLILDMVFRADNMKWQVADSVLEALILEANLIKKHQPYYNTREKDDKSFNYVCITKEKLPKVVVVRGSNLKNQVFSKIYGPYPNASQLKEALKIIRKIFPFLDDKSKNYIEFYRQINLAPDLNDLSAPRLRGQEAGRTMYLENIKNIKLFFSGKKRQIFKNLKKEMNNYAKMREFEKASEIKRQLFALQHINDVSLLKNDGSASYNFSSLRPSRSTEWDPREQKIKRSFARIEAYDIAHMGGKNMVGVMTVVENSQAVKSEYKKFKIRTQDGSNDTGALSEILERRLAHPEWAYPDLIVVDGGAAQINVAKKVLNNLPRGTLGIKIVSVVKDERHRPKNILGDKEIASKYESVILLANSEAHRFAITYHKKMRNKNFLK